MADVDANFLEYYQFTQSFNAFIEESRIFQDVSFDQWRPSSDFKRKDERQAAMQEFKKYLETKGSVHSQNTEFLAYYALPYVAKPNEHPIYQQLFEESWRKSVISRISKFIDSVIQPNTIKTPRLINLVTRPNAKQDRLMKQLSLSDAEKRAAQSQKRFARLQTDYQTLISVTADILDALENSLKGKTLDSSVMQRIYSRLVHSQNSGGVRLSDQYSQFNKTPTNGYETREQVNGYKGSEFASEKSFVNGGPYW
ncbi:unnamed protein product [Trichobilharzia regenti]|nr:unnamed protein product [Trichobilharzia regenti]